MNAFLNPRNGSSLINIIEVTAHSISLFQENEQLKNINGMFIPQASVSIAERVDVQINELGNDIIQVYQFISIISDERIPGLESTLHYMNENYSSNDDPALYEHRYHIIKNNTTKKHITHNIDKTTTYNIKHNRYTDEHDYNKKQHINNSITNNMGKKLLYLMNFMY